MNSYLSIHQDRFKYILKEIQSLSLPSTAKLLDIGCFPTHLFDILAATYQTYGVSSPHEPIKRKNILIADIEKDKVNFSARSFDLIICTEVLEHLVNPKNLFQEAKRLLRPGGYFLITTPNSTRLQNIVKLLFNKNIYFHLDQLLETNLKTINHRHNREYTQSELEHLVNTFGLNLVKSTSFTSYTATRIRQVSFLKQVLAIANQLVTTILRNRRDTLYILAQNT